MCCDKHFNVVLVFVLVSMCCDKYLNVALVFLLVSMCCDKHLNVVLFECGLGVPAGVDVL